MAPRQALQITSAEFAAAATALSQLPPPVGVEIAFAGRSNVGKSSLMNRLMQRKNLVRTSGTPGCTRQINFFSATASDGVRFTLVDLPGYGYARRSKAEKRTWGELIESYLLGRPTLRAVVALVDARRGIEDDDRDLYTLCESKPRVSRAPLSVVVAATKLDKIPSSAQRAAVAKLRAAAGRPVIGCSGETGDGCDELWRVLRVAAGVGAGGEERGAAAG